MHPQNPNEMYGDGLHHFRVISTLGKSCQSYKSSQAVKVMHPQKPNEMDGDGLHYLRVWILLTHILT